jgi:hypothetical protein
MSFLNIALRNAARGFRVHPLRGKDAFIKDWPNAATTDEKQIREWAAKFTDYNCGVAGGPDVAIVDSDRVSRLRELAGEHAADWFNTFSVTSGRPDRAHFYYRMTDEVREFGNKRWAEPGIKGNVFEVKVHGGQVVAEGSVHPDTGQEYRITQDVPCIPFPVGLMALIREYYGKDNAEPRERVPRGKISEGGRHDALVKEAGRVLRVTEMSKPVLTAHLQDFNEQWLEPPLDAEEVERVALSCNWQPEPAQPVVTIGKGKIDANTEPEAAKLPERVRPDYPITAWEGTVVAEFAKLCASDNNIPRKLFAEAFRCALGAVVGDRLECPEVDGGLPRSFTVIVAPKGKGKGTAIRRAVRFFSQTWSGMTSVTPGLLSGARDFLWKPKGIGAWVAAASSVPGMSRLTKDLESTIKNKPHLTWGNTLPRILSVHEEMKTFLSTLFIEGGVGSGMEGVVCQLWDDVSFHGTATGTRDAVYGEMMFSMLCGVTEQDWFDLLSRGNAVGGGLMSRFNLIGTEGEYENVSRINPTDFTALQTTFLPRVARLEGAHVKVTPTEAAKQIIGEWADNLPEGSERMNIHAWRSALLIAWLRHEDSITAKTAEDAVRLGQYQIASHDYYRTQSADNAVAKVQAKIVRALELKGPSFKRTLQQRTHAHRDGTELWNRALDGLWRDKAIGKRDDGAYYLAG